MFMLSNTKERERWTQRSEVRITELSVVDMAKNCKKSNRFCLRDKTSLFDINTPNEILETVKGLAGVVTFMAYFLSQILLLLMDKIFDILKAKQLAIYQKDYMTSKSLFGVAVVAYV